MKGRTNSPLSLPLSVLLVGWLCVGLATGGEPVSYALPQCPNKVYVESGMIIDIQSSRERGAVLIEGRREKSADSCVQKCCGVRECELTVYKVDGYSSAGHNCYLIHCGEVEKCKMVSHRGFESTFQQKLIWGSRIGE